MIKKFFVFSVFLVLSACLFIAAEAHAVSWKYDLPAALKDASSSGKPVMADFYTDWCGWCKKLDSDTYANPNIEQLARNFICVKIDGDKSADVVARYGVSGYPTVIFFSPSGTIMEKVVGYEGPVPFGQKMSTVLEKTPKPAAGGFNVTNEASGNKKNTKAPSVNSDFVYNGYIEVAGEGITAQVNYGRSTYFLQEGDSLRDYKVVSVDKENVILEGTGDRIVLEYKKPFAKGEVLGKIAPASEPQNIASGENILSQAAAVAAVPGTIDNSSLARIFLIVIGVTLAILALLYLYFALCLYFIAKKTQTARAWLAWIPIANIFLMCSIGRIRLWWLLLLLVPIVNIFIMLFMWFKVIKARGKPGWLLILFLIPVVNYVVMGYLAFSRKNNS